MKKSYVDIIRDKNIIRGRGDAAGDYVDPNMTRLYT